MNYKEYPDDLIELAFLDIPISEKQPDGFLDIIDKKYDEVINSRIYCYFLTQSNNQDIAKVFISSLLQLIEAKTNKLLRFESYSCDTEITTKNGKRIDIVINSIDDNNAIIIENKIFHGLFNDLNEYWNHFNYADENKVGILLTINKQDIPVYAKNKFINITHSELINTIKQNGLPSGLPLNLYTYINDFIKNMKNLSQSNVLNPQAKFFFEHTPKVVAAEKSRIEAANYINNQIRLAASILEMKMQVLANKHYHYFKKREDVFYAIGDWRLLEKKGIWINIELGEKVKSMNNNLVNALKESPEYKNLDNIEKGAVQNKQYWQFVRKYYILTNEQIFNLSTFIVEKIQSDFEQVMQIMINTIDKKDVANTELQNI